MPTLTKDNISRDLVDAGRQINEAIQSGNVSGMIFGCHLKGRRYIVNVAGSLARDPTLARGIAAALDDELARMVQGKMDSETTL